MTEKQHIMIKGVKEGLVFLLDDKCEFAVLLDELQYKLEKTHQQLLTGPLVHVHVKLGTRQLGEDDKERIKSVIRSQGNLMVQSIESSAEMQGGANAGPVGPHVITGIVRSGQTIEHDGDLLLAGDVNPGGTILCSGDIYVMGALRGVAHAGVNGRTDVIIAASLMRPTQLRIADIISRPPEEWMSGDAAMEFAYLYEGNMQIDKMTQLFRLRNNPIKV
ncbi:septum site-determining protein MinC [Paenibacillus sp. BK033]|uniref:septum site-determining protein MinC n=1 Tax=unclassified Paenibacillus TaxID=185978 RepID=UPI0010DAAB83|nr:septum site-determining protein MinC [Paenibacillus sp. BK033]NIK69843.1 septum site-determining protein MinC [Paenibacillus sp. BK720]TCM97677.1 septum site-determining protein MinC [Paenibacillus sp. BK033]